MSEPLDVSIGTPDGSPLPSRVSMFESFASSMVAQEIDSGVYPLLRSMWDYRSTPVPRDRIPELRAEITNVIKAVSKHGEAQAVIDELDKLLVFLKTVDRLGLGVFVSGP